jgi:hypothetical protein
VLAYRPTLAGTLLVRGRVDNDYTRATVAILDVDAPAMTSPKHRGTGFSCGDCPIVGARFFALLSRTELTRLSAMDYNAANKVFADGSGLKINIERGWRRGLPLQLGRRLDVRDTSLNDNYWQSSRERKQPGTVAAEGPDLHKPQTLRRGH